jgi:AcrR family transcriptional regulator
VAERALRADARRNRQRVLEVAAAAFAGEGLGVSVHEIARRAQVGTGTVSRHFPTKEALVRAIVLDRVERVIATARRLSAELPPAEAFFEFFGYLVEQSAADAGLAGALAGAGFDLEAVAAGSGVDFSGAVEGLLTAAQGVGAVRDDVRVGDVKALVAGCLAAGGAEARARLVSVVVAGLAPSR